MARRLRGLVRTVKVGSVLFTACGPEAIRSIRALGFEVMLDVKFFDIPNTIALSCRAAVTHQVSMVTVHASGGTEMILAAVAGIHEEAGRLHVPPPAVIGVTVLTSVESGESNVVARRVKELARVAMDAGCDGLVASAHEVAELRKLFGRRARLMCPGIRPASWSRDDQRRVCTPADALRAGADQLIVGRPITASADPRSAALHLLAELAHV